MYRYTFSHSRIWSGFVGKLSEHTFDSLAWFFLVAMLVLQLWFLCVFVLYPHRNKSGAGGGVDVEITSVCLSFVWCYLLNLFAMAVYHHQPECCHIYENRLDCYLKQSYLDEDQSNSSNLQKEKEKKKTVLKIAIFLNIFQPNFVRWCISLGRQSFMEKDWVALLQIKVICFRVFENDCPMPSKVLFLLSPKLACYCGVRFTIYISCLYDLYFYFPSY